MLAKCWIISACALFSRSWAIENGRISHNERNNVVLRRAEEPPLLDPHHLPQCVKHEPGCKVSKVDTILELFDPVSWFVNTAVKVKERAQKYVSVFLYQQTFDWQHCQGNSEHHFFGGKGRYHRKIPKNECEEWDMLPVANVSMNYVLPDSKIDNHCDMTFFDGRGCTGNEVYKLKGEYGVQMINGQSYCHVMQYPKSVFVGPCS
ncbi:unnamed protein product [Cercospora beticola]|nr:unnamed protein product [Cercospora beticola]